MNTEQALRIRRLQREWDAEYMECLRPASDHHERSGPFRRLCQPCSVHPCSGECRVIGKDARTLDNRVCSLTTKLTERSARFKHGVGRRETGGTTTVCDALPAATTYDRGR